MEVLTRMQRQINYCNGGVKMKWQTLKKLYNYIGLILFQKNQIGYLN